MRIHMKTLGCRLNEAELESWGQGFQALGHQLVQTPEEADLLVVNTCAVTQEAVRKSRKLLAGGHRRNPHARLVVSGCYASLDPSASARAEGVDLVVSNQDKEHLVEIVSRELDLRVMPEAAINQAFGGLLQRGRQRAFIKVQDGCRYRCSYCVVTLARGEERSRPAGEIIDQINRLHGEGIQEVVLAGVHLGGYGSDLGSDLKTLIGQILAHTDIPRLRLGSLEPWDLPDGFWGLFDDPRLMPHLHLPLQSGSDQVLRRMARRCKSAEYRRLVTQARERVRDFNLTSDIIVGFPGESEAEWQETLAFVREIGFGHLHIFAYSPRAGTKAAGMADPVSQEVKRRRSTALHQLADQMKQQTLRTYVGRTLPVLIEGSGETNQGGYTPNYLRVALERADRRLCNRIIRVRFKGLQPDGDRLVGEWVGDCPPDPKTPPLRGSACETAGDR